MRKIAVDGSKPKLLAGVMLAALLSACSSDVSRFNDPFGNPFKGSSRFDNPNTGSVRQPSGRDMRRENFAPVTTGAVNTSSLSDTSQRMPAASRPLMSEGQVQGLNPSAKASGFKAGVASANYPNLAPVAQRSGTALSTGSVATSTSGWTAMGGTPVTLGQGDSVSSLSSRYGVPASAIMAVNGLNPSSRVSPGQQLVIPAYNPVHGGSAQGAVAPVARLEPPRPVAPMLEPRRAEPAKVVAEAAPRAAAPARQVGAPVESDAEKRAAAKLRELKGAKPAAKDDDEDEAPAKAAPAKAAPAKVTPAKAAAADESRQRAEKAKLEKEKAEKAAKAESDKARVAKLEAEKAKAEKLKAEKLAKAKKAAEDDVETTASIPQTRLPERAASMPKLSAKAPEPEAPKAPAAAARNEESAGSDSFRWPAKGRVISGFGSRGSGGSNDGINIAVPEGTPVRAAEGGTVVHADDALKGYGKMVLIRHPNGFVSVYAHNGELNVKRGESVKRGQVIAHSGATGNVTSPQLHFELRKGATPVDPTARLAD